jgi:hypothetical protein
MLDVLDLQRLHEHITQVRYIDPKAPTTPLPTSGTTTLTMVPETETLISQEGQVEIQYTLTLTPPAGTNAGCYDFTIVTPKGITLKKLALSDDAKQQEIFHHVWIGNSRLILAGSDLNQTNQQSFPVATATFVIEDGSLIKKYQPTIQVTASGTDGKTESTLKITCKPIRVVATQEDVLPDGSTENESSNNQTVHFLYGDVNGDTTVNALDALITLQSSVGDTDLNDFQCTVANVSGDNNLNAADALLILQYALEKIDQFPVES